MLQTYRRVLANPGTLRFSATGLVARLPIAMVGLGIVLLVSTKTGSYGLAGAVSAAFLLANGLMAIPIGRIIDTVGQPRVLTVAASVCAAGLVLLTTAVQGEWPLIWAFVGAVLGGLASPPIGSCVRARWSHVLDRPADVQTAYALEGVVDEACFILGPILVTILATSVHPVAGLGAAVATGFLGSMALAAQPATSPPPRIVNESDGPRPALPWGTILPLAVVALCLGSFFGSAEVATVAFSEELGLKKYAGFLLGLWALGSLTSGIITGAMVWRISTTERVRRGTLALTVVMSPMVFIDSMLLMGGALFLAGFAIAPTLIAALSLTEQRVPRERLTEGMAFIHTGIVAGVAPGATLAGFIVDHVGASQAYLVAVGAGLLASIASRVLPGDSDTARVSDAYSTSAGVGSPDDKTL